MTPVCAFVRVFVCVHVCVCVLAQEISISSLMETANRGTNKMQRRRANPPCRGPVRMDDEANMKQIFCGYEDRGGSDRRHRGKLR